MTRRRRMFDIDVPAEEVISPQSEVDASNRRGPMATAVRENAEALRARQAVEDRIRVENDALAHEHVRLKKAGLILDMIPTQLIDSTKLVRDRSSAPDESLDELKASIMAIGLSNPIRVEKKADGRYELIQGSRRLRAFAELEAENGDGRFSHIPAGYVAAGDALATSYRRMVDENLVRKDISFAEMAALARAYVADEGTDCEDIDKAVATLFRSAGYQKRSYIRAFVELLDMLGEALAHPEAIGRNLGLELRRRLDGNPAAVARVKSLLTGAPGRTADQETALLRGFIDAVEPARPRAPVSKSGRRAKTSLRIASARGEFRCLAANGRLDLRGPSDFADVDPRRLEAAVSELIAALGLDRPDDG
ncbi:MAG: replication protein [Phycisphaerales bacterium]|nr:MAG: replication protein [Phycisphaerales bacterium]